MPTPVFLLTETAKKEKGIKMFSGPPPPPGPPPTNYSGPPSTWNLKEGKGVYEKCKTSGETRFKAQPMRLGDTKKKIFEEEYTTEKIAKAASPGGWAYDTRWKGSNDPSAHYENSPLPESGEILAWENKRNQKNPEEQEEPLQNSDVFYFQYMKAAGEPGVRAQPLQSMTRQQVANETTRGVRDWIRFGKGKEEATGKWKAGEDDFYAFLGTPNGTGPAFLVTNYGDRLGINDIAQIEFTSEENLIFTFTTMPAIPTGEGTQVSLSQMQLENTSTAGMGETLPF